MSTDRLCNWHPTLEHVLDRVYPIKFDGIRTEILQITCSAGRRQVVAETTTVAESGKIGSCGFAKVTNFLVVLIVLCR